MWSSLTLNDVVGPGGLVGAAHVVTSPIVSVVIGIVAGCVVTVCVIMMVDPEMTFVTVEPP